MDGTPLKQQRLCGFFGTLDDSPFAGLAISEEEQVRIRADLLSRLGQAEDPFQAFVQGYIARGRMNRVERICFNIDLLTAVVPPDGSWLDVGSFGYDAWMVKARRPDIHELLLSFEGGAVFCDDTGFHFGTGAEPGCVLVRACDAERTPLPYADASLDVVSLFEVLEHFKYGPQMFMTEVNRILKPGGRLVMTTPNITSATALTRAMMGEHPAEVSFYHLDFAHGRVHPLEYTRRQLTDLLTAFGFVMERYGTFNIGAFTKEECDAIEVAEAHRARRGLPPSNDYGEKHFVIAVRTGAPSGRLPESVFA